MDKLLASIVLLALWQTGVKTDPDYSDADRLIQDIQLEYNANIRPVTNQSAQIDVGIMVKLAGLADFDEVLGTLSTAAFLLMMWQDERIEWNSSLYGGLEAVDVRHSNFLWTPTIMLTNSASEVRHVFDGRDNPAYLYQDGFVVSELYSLLQSFCHVDITYYPFDTQRCRLNFFAVGYIMGEVHFLEEWCSLEMKYFTATGEWTLTSTEIEYDADDDGFVGFTLVFKRKPEYVMFNIVTPLVVLSVLSIFVFCIPASAGERISYCLTVFLSLVVFLTIVGQTLPKTSQPLPWLSILLVNNVLISILITIVVILNMRLFERGDSEVEGCWKRFWYFASQPWYMRSDSQQNKHRKLRQIRPQLSGRNEWRKPDNVPTGRNHHQLCKSHSKTPSNPAYDGHTNVEDILSAEYDTNISTVYRNQKAQHEITNKCHQSTANTDDKAKANQDCGDSEMVTWKKLSEVVDKISFALFMMLLCVNYLVFSLVIATNV